MQKANKPPARNSRPSAKVPVAAPKTPSPPRLKLICTPPPSNDSPATTGNTTTSIGKSDIFDDLTIPSAARRRSTRAIKPSSKAVDSDLTSVPAPARTLKRKAASDNDNTEAKHSAKPAPTHATKKKKTSPDAVSTTVEQVGKAIGKATDKAENTQNPTSKKRKSIDCDINNETNKAHSKPATALAPPPKRDRKSRNATMNSPQDVMDGGTEPIATDATVATVAPVTDRRAARAARAARRNGEEGDAELVALDIDRTNSKRKYQAWADPNSSEWDVIRFLQDDEMLAPDNLLQLPPKGFEYIDEVNGRLRNPNKYAYSHSKPAKANALRPKLLEHIKNGSDTAMVRLYYEDMPRKHVVPFAGRIDIPETGSGWKPGPPGRGRRARMTQTNDLHDTGVPAPVIAPGLISENSDQSSSLTTPSSTSESEPPFTPASSPAPAPTVARKKRSDPADKIFIAFPGLAANYDVLTNRDSQEETFHTRPSIHLPVPDHIKAILVDDWENVTKNQQLVPLPAAQPVNKILDDYLDYEQPRRQTGTPQADILLEVIAGLKEYFEKTLGRILLYR